MAGGGDPKKAIMFAFAANGGIAVLKFIAAFISMSTTMMAEAIHSLADCGNQVLLLIGLKSAKALPDEEHPLGQGKVIYFWSFIVAVMLFSVGGLYSLYEGWHKLHATEVPEKIWLVLSVLVISILLEGAALRVCLKEVNKIRGKRSLLQWFKESRQSELLVIFCEDFAALLGLSLAVVFVVLTQITGNPIYDAIGSMAIGFLLVVVAIFLTVQIKKLLVGRSAEPELRENIEFFVRDFEGVEEVYKVITFQLGDKIMVAVKARVEAKNDANKMVEIINDCERALKERFPEILWIFFEPDNEDE